MTFWINAVGICLCQLDLCNKVNLFDPDLAFPSWLNVKFRVSWLHVNFYDVGSETTPYIN